MMSSRIRSGLCCSTFSSASTPSLAVIIFTGSASRNAWSNSTFCTLSSTIMTVDWGRNDSELAGGWPGACDIGGDSITKCYRGKAGGARTTICTLTIPHGSCFYASLLAAERTRPDHIWRYHDPIVVHPHPYRFHSHSPARRL